MDRKFNFSSPNNLKTKNIHFLDRKNAEICSKVRIFETFGMVYYQEALAWCENPTLGCRNLSPPYSFFFLFGISEDEWGKMWFFVWVRKFEGEKSNFFGALPLKRKWGRGDRMDWGNLGGRGVSVTRKNILVEKNYSQRFPLCDNHLDINSFRKNYTVGVVSLNTVKVGTT